MNGTLTILLLTALRIIVPALVLLGIGTYVERRQRRDCEGLP